MENNKIMTDYEIGLIEKRGEIAKKALKIVEKLSKNGIADCDGCLEETDEVNEIKSLIVESRTLMLQRESYRM